MATGCQNILMRTQQCKLPIAIEINTFIEVGDNYKHPDLLKYARECVCTYEWDCHTATRCSVHDHGGNFSDTPQGQAQARADISRLSSIINCWVKKNYYVPFYGLFDDRSNNRVKTDKYLFDNYYAKLSINTKDSEIVTKILSDIRCQLNQPFDALSQHFLALGSDIYDDKRFTNIVGNIFACSNKSGFLFNLWKIDKHLPDCSIFCMPVSGPSTLPDFIKYLMELPDSPKYSSDKISSVIKFAIYNKKILLIKKYLSFQNYLEHSIITCASEASRECIAWLLDFLFRSTNVEYARMLCNLLFFSKINDRYANEINIYLDTVIKNTSLVLTIGTKGWFMPCVLSAFNYKRYDSFKKLLQIGRIVDTPGLTELFYVNIIKKDSDIIMIKWILDWWIKHNYFYTKYYFKNISQEATDALCEYLSKINAKGSNSAKTCIDDAMRCKQYDIAKALVLLNPKNNSEYFFKKSAKENNMANIAWSINLWIERSYFVTAYGPTMTPKIESTIENYLSNPIIKSLSCDKQAIADLYTILDNKRYAIAKLILEGRTLVLAPILNDAIIKNNIEMTDWILTFRSENNIFISDVDFDDAINPAIVTQLCTFIHNYQTKSSIECATIIIMIRGAIAGHHYEIAKELTLYDHKLDFFFQSALDRNCAEDVEWMLELWKCRDYKYLSDKMFDIKLSSNIMEKIITYLMVGYSFDAYCDKYYSAIEQRDLDCLSFLHFYDRTIGDKEKFYTNEANCILHCADGNQLDKIKILHKLFCHTDTFYLKPMYNKKLKKNQVAIANFIRSISSGATKNYESKLQKIEEQILCIHNDSVSTITRLTNDWDPRLQKMEEQILCIYNASAITKLTSDCEPRLQKLCEQISCVHKNIMQTSNNNTNAVTKLTNNLSSKIEAMDKLLNKINHSNKLQTKIERVNALEIELRWQQGVIVVAGISNVVLLLFLVVLLFV